MSFTLLRIKTALRDNDELKDIKWKGYQTSRLYKYIVPIQHHIRINDRLVENTF